MRLADLLPGDLLFYAYDGHDAASIDNPTGARSPTPLETERLTQQVDRLLGEAEGAAPQAEATIELRRLLSALHAVLTLHVAPEGEGAFP